MRSARKKPYVAVSGVMGSGKTTAAKLLAEKFGFHLIEEKVDTNRFLPLFYENPRRWAFHNQIFILRDRVRQVLQAKESWWHGVVQDVPLEQAFMTYGLAQKHLGNMTSAEFELYDQLFDFLTEKLPKPDCIIYIDTSLPVIMKRIEQRGRNFESQIDPSYVKLLFDLQNSWIDSCNNVFAIPADNLNLVSDEKDRQYFVQLISKKIFYNSLVARS